jgi:fructose-1,6-bisphosphatase
MCYTTAIKQGGGGSVNIQGEEQKKLDVISNDVLKDCLRYTGEHTCNN